VEQNFETIWRMAKVAGGIDATVKYVETVIATLPTFTFRNTSGKEMPIRDPLQQPVSSSLYSVV
jgi:hypothetical protein